MAEFMKIEINRKEMDRMFADMPKKLKAATANTLNTVARKVNKNVKNNIANVYNVPKSSMRFGDLITIKRANAQANIGKAVIFIRRQGRGLIKYRAVQTKTGLAVAVKKQRKSIPHGFIAPLRKGGSDKFAFIKATGKLAGKITRVSKTGKSYQAAKRAILWGPQIAQLYTNKRAERVILETIDDEFQKTLDVNWKKQFEKGRR
jgi:hypothetical protein